MSAADAPGSPTPPIFFTHVMKTGGFTLFRYLSLRYGPDELYPNPEVDARFDGPRLDLRHQFSIARLVQLPPERRERIRVYAGHFPFVAQELLGGGMPTATILRHPVDRTLSLLRQVRRRPPWVKDPKRLPRLAGASFEEAYEDVTTFEQLVHDHQTKIFSMRPDDRPETFLDPIVVDRSRLELAKANLATIDVVGTMERYDEFLDDVERRFGWRVPRTERVNVSPDDGEVASEALRRRIAADNAIDLELYEYAVELVRSRRATRSVGS